ncbi:MAG: hypothetical protein R6V44_03280 [Paracoccaceae bacterium]
MRMYAHDHVWGCQDRRGFADPPGSFLIDVARAVALWAAKAVADARARRR